MSLPCLRSPGGRACGTWKRRDAALASRSAYAPRGSPLLLSPVGAAPQPLGVRPRAFLAAGTAARSSPLAPRWLRTRTLAPRTGSRHGPGGALTCRAVLTPAVAVSPWVTLLISAGNALSSWAPHVLDATSLFTGLTIAVMPLYGLMIARPRDPLVRPAWKGGGGRDDPGAGGIGSSAGTGRTDILTAGGARSTKRGYFS